MTIGIGGMTLPDHREGEKNENQKMGLRFIAVSIFHITIVCWGKDYPWTGFGASCKHIDGGMGTN
jgi:hypothetical protein